MIDLVAFSTSSRIRATERKGLEAHLDVTWLL
jgi:hypothetical protein